jgi:hypothetical protein
MLQLIKHVDKGRTDIHPFSGDQSRNAAHLFLLSASCTPRAALTFYHKRSTCSPQPSAVKRIHDQWDF